MLFGGVMRGVGPSLVIEIVQQSSDSPQVFVGAGLLRIGTHTSLYGQGVLTQAFSLGVFAQQVPSVIAIQHAMSPRHSVSAEEKIARTVTGARIGAQLVILVHGTQRRQKRADRKFSTS